MIENEIFVVIGSTKYRMKIPANIKIEANHIEVEVDKKRYKLKEDNCGCSSQTTGGSCCSSK